jgi:hypothetical protein
MSDTHLSGSTECGLHSALFSQVESFSFLTLGFFNHLILPVLTSDWDTRQTRIDSVNLAKPLSDGYSRPIVRGKVESVGKSPCIRNKRSSLILLFTHIGFQNGLSFTTKSNDCKIRLSAQRYNFKATAPTSNHCMRIR